MMPSGFNPYQPPAMLEQPLEESPLSALEARQRLQLPAYGQITAGVFGILFCLFLLWALIIANPHESSTFGGLVRELFVPVLIVGALGVINLVIILGGRAMLAIRHYRLARWSAVMTIAFLGGSCPLGLPFGVWALIVLHNRRVRAAFIENARAAVARLPHGN
jgi:hypothetical protein